MPKFETRDLIAVLALGLMAFALWLDTAGHPIPEWSKAPLATVVTVVLGYYFVDSARRAQGGAPSPSGQSAPQTTKPDEPPPAQ